MTDRRSVERGDFQTPLLLARRLLGRARARGLRAASVLEPTCGRGAFLEASLDLFPDLTKVVAFDIDPGYVEEAQAAVRRCLESRVVPYVSRTTEKVRSDRRIAAQSVSIECANMFRVDWRAVIAGLPEPMLVTGNPPWVTTAAVSAAGGSNTPERSPQAGWTGLGALTGKSNFDLSEWLLLRILEACRGREAIVAMLVKTQVARRVLTAAWSNKADRRRFLVADAALYRIDASAAFGASVDACWFVCTTRSGDEECALFDDVGAEQPRSAIAVRADRLVADLGAYERCAGVVGRSPEVWRSGIKHDCARVMELVESDSRLVNGFGETVDVEHASVFPMLKSSEVAAASSTLPRRWMVVPQRAVGEDTSLLERNAPRTWAYLLRHAERLDRRASAIYRRRPRFSIFGIGEYSFRPWKVAISGLYKNLRFKMLGPRHARPVVFDDTVYFLSFERAEDAHRTIGLLESSLAEDYFRAFVFIDSKRPITAELLNGLDLGKLRPAPVVRKPPHE